MSNYESATKTIYGGVDRESVMLKANALATLALVDEMRAAREPEIKEVFLIVQYRAADNTEHEVMTVYKDRLTAYSERDGLNALAQRLNDPFRYIVKEKEIR